METMQHDPAARLRLIEGWLPLAEAANVQYGWHLDGPALEDLILVAAPDLRAASSALAAQAVLWHYHQRRERAAP